MTRSMERFADVSDLHLATADAFCHAVQESLQERDVFRVSLSGGSTPKKLYELLSTRDLPWDKIHWFWGDERNVLHDHADSNARMVREVLLDCAPIPQANIHPVEVDVENPAAVAKQYEATLREFFSEDPFPRWELALLGMGDDGHTASLFPHTAALNEQEKWFVENWVEKFDAFRYTLTAPAINSAQRIWFLVSGQNKQSALQEVLSDNADASMYPSRLIRPTQWFVTEDAIA